MSAYQDTNNPSKSPQIATVGVLEASGVADATGLSVPIQAYKRDKWHAQLVKTWGMTGKKWELGTCKGCRTDIDPSPIPLDWADGSEPIQIPITVCDECMELVRESYGLVQSTGTQPVHLEPKWEAECPLRFRELILSDAYPSQFDQEAKAKVMDWDMSWPKGLALKGDSGAGKTTSLWALFRKLERGGGNPKFLTGVELNRILARASRDLESVEWLWKAHILMIDDFGKEKHSPGASSLLWEVLDRRYQNKLPIILSTRYSGAEIRERFAERLGDDIVRRLNETCRAIEFKLR